MHLAECSANKKDKNRKIDQPKSEQMMGWKQFTQEVMKNFTDSEILGVTSKANFFGVLSKGKMQIRGNGILILTMNQIYFELWKPNRKYTIPITQIKSVSHPKWFLGKSKFRNLLRIDFVNESHENDAIAWLIPDLSQWESSITILIEKNIN